MKKMVSRFAVVLIMTMIMIPDFAWADVGTTENDISSTNITGMAVTKTDESALDSGTIETGSNILVKINFSDKGGMYRIKGGDVIKVSWPTSGNAYFQGYSSSIPLKISYHGQNYNVGTAEVTAEGATITFNNAIDSMTDVEGYAQFQMQGWNATAGNEEDTKAATIIAGAQTKTVSIHRGTSEAGEEVFYYKNGLIRTNDTEHIEWFLNVNMGCVTVDSNSIINDTIQGGQILDPSTFNIAFIKNGAWMDESYQGVEGIAEFMQKYPGSSITYDTATGVINVKLDKATVDGRGVSISYKTEITDKTLSKFENNTTASYHESGKDAVTDKVENVSVDNINSSAGVKGLKKGELKISKVITGTTTPIAGVTFALSRTDGADVTTGNKTVTLTTDSKGEASIKDLSEGEYSVKETSAPSWISFDAATATPETFTVAAADTEGHNLKFENNKKKTDISATKVWETTETSKPDTWFKLYRKIDGGEAAAVAGADVKKLSNGVERVSWANMDVTDDAGNAYVYSVKEVDANGNDAVPEGYAKEENGLTVTNTLKPADNNGNPRTGGGTTGTGNGTSGSGNSSGSTVPKTGDCSNIPMYSIILMIAGLGCTLMVMLRKKRGDNR